MSKLAKGLNITGNTVSSKDDAFFYHMISGKNGIFNYGNKMSFQTISSNLIRIKDGMAQIQGRNYIIYPSETVDVTVESGTQGNKRYDLIVLELSKLSSSEEMTLKCIKGTATTGNPVDPTLIQQDTLSSGTKYQLPLYRVKLNGINIEGVDDLRKYIPSFDELVSKEALDEFIDELTQNGSRIDVNRANKLKSYAGNSSVYFGYENGVLNAKVDNTPVMMENSKLWNGAKIYRETKIFNPGGNDYVLWDISSLNVGTGAVSAFCINANYQANNIFTTGIALRNENRDLVIKIDRAVSTPFQLDLVVIYV